MSVDLIIDNWMLQEIRQIFEKGLSSEEAGEIAIDINNESHSFIMKPHALFQIDSLLALLVNIVLRDKLIVDDRFTHVWDERVKSLEELKTMHILNTFNFSVYEENLIRIREAIVEELCVTRSIRSIQRMNEILWNERRESFDQHMSQLVWGGAGYLARSHVYTAPYLGCPYRQALIRQSKFVGWRHDAVKEMETIISTKRTKLFQSFSDDRSTKYVTFNLPPIAVEIINESSNIDQLVPVAIQLREKYKKLREWLFEYQNALDSDSPKSILKNKKIFESITRNIESKYTSVAEGSTNVSMGFNWFSLSMPAVKIVDKLANLFGVRAMLNDLVFAERGEKSLQKLLLLFGEKNTKLSRVVYQNLLERYSEKL